MSAATIHLVPIRFVTMMCWSTEAASMPMTRVSTMAISPLKPGDLVVSTPSDDYVGLVGIVLQIAPLGSEEHDTDNETDDVYVDFENDYTDFRIAEIENVFSELYCMKKEYDDLPLGEVIMDPMCLIRITDLSETAIKRLLESEANAIYYCYNVLWNLYQEKCKLAHEDKS